MKKFSISCVCCLMFALAFLVSACTIGSYDVTFVDYNGTIIGTRTYGASERITNANSPTPPTREGFDFWEWSYDNPSNIVPNGEVTTENIIFAKYKLNINSTVFNESGRKINWYGGTSSTSTYFNAGQTKTILINDGTGLQNLSTVTISASSGSNFSLADFKVYDANGYEVNRNSTISNIWAVESADAGNYSFALVITAEYAGEVTIQAC